MQTDRQTDSQAGRWADGPPGRRAGRKAGGQVGRLAARLVHGTDRLADR